MNIVAIYGSPREGGNTDLLLQSFVRGARGAGGNVQELALRDYHFSYCVECGGCIDTGECVIQDDMQKIYPYFKKSQVIVLAAPVFFYNVSALTKAMIDRCQCFWAGKYLLQHPLSRERGCRGKGIFLTVGGSKGKKNFEGILLTVRYFFDALDVDFTGHLLYRQIDEKGAIARHPSALEEGFKLGRAVVEE